MELTAQRLARIPHTPGVYTFTRRGVPLYVGKAADLRQRLAAYRTEVLHRDTRPWTNAMVREATGLHIELTASEVEALLLEANRIHALQPKYNIRNRSDVSFCSILVTDEEFPRVLTTRSLGTLGSSIGPFTSAHAVRETLRALRKIFPFRCNRMPQAPESQLHGQRCLSAHLGLCAGTCAGRITAREYRRRVITPLLRLLRGATASARRLLDPEHQRLLDDVLAHTRVLSVTEKYAADLRELQRVLRLPSLPHRIEGYDISNIGGDAAVGSMVVAIDGEPAPHEYRKFKIRMLEGRANDVGMLREVLTRRLRHREWPLPDLILIDGGKPQRNAALRVLRNAHAIVPLVALAKRAEELYLPDERVPLRLPGNSPALHLLQRVRDEAHRFAIQYHRLRYRKRLFR